MLALSADAQDVIFKRNGDEVAAKVTKISDSEIEYKKWANQNGPTYTIKTDDVFMIKYENGTKDVFDGDSYKKPEASEAPAESTGITASTDNEYSQYAKRLFNNQSLDYIGKDKGKKAGDVLWVFGLTDESVIADENIELTFEMGYYKDKASVMSKRIDLEYVPAFLGVPPAPANITKEPAIRVVVKNKSSKTMYLDLGNCFVKRGEKTQMYYVPEATTVASSTSGGASVNLGVVSSALNGISVGGGTSTSTSTTTYSQRVVAIPPNSSRELDPQYIGFDVRKAKDVKDDMTADFNVQGITIGSLSGRIVTYLSSLNRGEVLEYDEKLCCFRFGNTIAYSFSENCSSLKTVTADFYIKYMVGINSRLPYKIQEVLPSAMRMIAYPSRLEEPNAKLGKYGYPRP